MPIPALFALLVPAALGGPTSAPTTVPATAGAPAASETPAPASDAVPAWAVILWGGTDRAVGEAWLAAYEAGGGPVRKEAGYPKIVDSTSIPKLKPGLLIVLAGQPEEQSVAVAMQARFRALSVPGVDLTGTYARPILTPDPEDLDPFALIPAGWRMLAVCNPAAVDGVIPETSEDWGFFANDVSTAASAAGIEVMECEPTKAIPVTHGGVTVGKVNASGVRDASGCGYLLAEPGKAPAWVPHAPPGEVLGAASEYFGIPVALPEP